MATKYEPTYRDFKRYTEDQFARTYRQDSDAAELVHDIIHGLGNTIEFALKGCIATRSQRLGKRPTQDQIIGMFHGVWLWLFKAVYDRPFTNPNRRH